MPEDLGVPAGEILPGGFINAVTRVGETVRRQPASAFVHRLLVHLSQSHWTGAPQFLGIDEQGREIVSFVDGYVPWQPEQAAAVATDEALIGVAELAYQLHELTAGTELAGDAETVCHHDLSPKNTVYRDAGSGWLPVAFIDWDLAGPGSRVQDIAHICWQYLDLGRTVTDPVEAARRVRLICDAYGLPTRSDVVPTILWWQDQCWRGIDAAATAGDPAMLRLRAGGAVAEVRAAYDWTYRHRATLSAAVR